MATDIANIQCSNVMKHLHYMHQKKKAHVVQESWLAVALNLALEPIVRIHIKNNVKYAQLHDTAK